MSYTEIYSKWIIDLYVKHKTIKPLEKCIGEHFGDLGLRKEFLDFIPKAQSIKGKLINWMSSSLKTQGIEAEVGNEGGKKIKNFCSAKDPISQRMETIHSNEEVLQQVNG